MVKKVKIKKGRYVGVRMPLEAYKNYKKRQEKMEKAVNQITKKMITIPLTTVFEVSSTAPINLDD